MRPKATIAGDISSTATLMNRYGMPQSSATTAKSHHARADIPEIIAGH